MRHSGLPEVSFPMRMRVVVGAGGEKATTSIWISGQTFTGQPQKYFCPDVFLLSYGTGLRPIS
jgi:hypothetical protein